MALRIKIPDSANSRQEVALGGEVLLLDLSFNSQNKGWYMSLKSPVDLSEILSGRQLKPNQNLTGRYFLDELPEGNIWCLRQTTSSQDITRDNLGVDKDFCLFYLSNSEEEELGINGKIQL